MGEIEPKARRHKTHRLDRIEAALARLDRGTYGYCQECSEPIAIHRLERDPAAATCEACGAQH